MYAYVITACTELGADDAKPSTSTWHQKNHSSKWCYVGIRETKSPMFASRSHSPSGVSCSEKAIDRTSNIDDTRTVCERAVVMYSSVVRRSSCMPHRASSIAVFYTDATQLNSLLEGHDMSLALVSRARFVILRARPVALLRYLYAQYVFY